MRTYLLETAALTGMVVLVLTLVSTSGVSRAVDNWVFSLALPVESGNLHPDVALIDLPYDAALEASGDPGKYRQRLASLLTALARRNTPPGTVILDIWFSASRQAEQPLTDAIRLLQQRGSNVLATVNPVNRHGAVQAGFMARHNRVLYQQVLNGYGHTLLENRQRILSYRQGIVIPDATDSHNGLTTALTIARVIPALPILAVRGNSAPVVANDSVVFAYRRPGSHEQVIRLDARDTFDPIDIPLALNRYRYLVIGSFDADSDNALQTAGPVLLGYALSNLLYPATPAPLNNAPVNLLISALCVVIASIIFVAGFRKIKRRRPPSQWASRSLLICLLALVSVATLLAVLFAVAWTGRLVIPLANPLFATAAACLALWLIVRQRQHDALSHVSMDEMIAEAAFEYDVFISYAHEPEENQRWVRQNVFDTLSPLRRDDGQPLKIFFDERSIRPGRQWKREIELALLGTRFFIPVYSERYFERAYCREELEIADQLRIENRLTILPIARRHDVIPERYLRKVQYLDASDPHLAAHLVAQIGAATPQADIAS